MAISEIGVSFPDDTFGEESRFGVPFTVSNKLWYPNYHLRTVSSKRCFTI